MIENGCTSRIAKLPITVAAAIQPEPVRSQAASASAASRMASATKMPVVPWGRITSATAAAIAIKAEMEPMSLYR